MGWYCPRCGELLWPSVRPLDDTEMYECPKDKSAWKVIAGVRPLIYNRAVLIGIRDGEQS